MPELAEIKIMSDHINNKCEGKVFFLVEKNPVHKSKTDLSVINELLSTGAKITSESRGKELRMDFENKEGKKNSLFFMMGMSGNFKFGKAQDEPKHTHLKFCTDNNEFLFMYDLRRFARWKVGSEWNTDRGPCPVEEFSDFDKHVKSNLNKRCFEKPIYEALMDQKYFNGIGNYLRAEILGRINSDPRQNARDYIMKNPDVLKLCKKIPQEAYVLGGGRLKDWYNNEQINEEGLDFKTWMGFYYNKDVCIPFKDSSGRTFWIDKKWK
jgi:endonuclease VIII-like 1